MYRGEIDRSYKAFHTHFLSTSAADSRNSGETLPAALNTKWFTTAEALGVQMSENHLSPGLGNFILSDEQRQKWSKEGKQYGKWGKEER